MGELRYRKSDDLKTSPNYLSDLLLDTANVPKNEIENFTSEVRNDVPQINAMGHYDSDGNWVTEMKILQMLLISMKR